MLDEARRFGENQLVVLSGGDPLARDDTVESIEYGAGRGLLMTLTPSGTASLTPDRVAAGARSLAVSVDGGTRPTRSRERSPGCSIPNAFGTEGRATATVPSSMPIVPRPWSSGDEDFDDYDAFVPAHLPAPGPFLDGHRVLTGLDHAAFHRLTRARFEARTVYDATFGYNLARLNLDGRHTDAGYRYAVDADDPAVLRAEFTPTTEFCPQSDTLATASFRAWNADDVEPTHEFDLVRVRVAPMHGGSERINDRLATLESSYRDAGELPEAEESEPTPRDGTTTPF